MISNAFACVWVCFAGYFFLYEIFAGASILYILHCMMCLNLNMPFCIANKIGEQKKKIHTYENHCLKPTSAFDWKRICYWMHLTENQRRSKSVLRCSKAESTINTIITITTYMMWPVQKSLLIAQKCNADLISLTWQAFKWYLVVLYLPVMIYKRVLLRTKFLIVQVYIHILYFHTLI